MNCTVGPIDTINGYNINTLFVNGVKLYHVNDYEDEVNLYAFNEYDYLGDERTCLFLDSLGDQYQILRYSRNKYNACVFENDDYYVSRVILEDYMNWCTPLIN